MSLRFWTAHVQKQQDALESLESNTLAEYKKIADNWMIPFIKMAASWGDPHGTLNKVCCATDRASLHNMLKNVRGLNPLSMGMHTIDFGPIQKFVLPISKHHITWYNVIKTGMLLAIRTSNWYINKIKKEEQKNNEIANGSIGSSNNAIEEKEDKEEPYISLIEQDEVVDDWESLV